MGSKRTSPLHRSLVTLRSQGWRGNQVERKVWKRTTRDYFGIGDAILVRGAAVLMAQATNHDRMAEHITKCLEQMICDKHDRPDCATCADNGGGATLAAVAWLAGAPTRLLEVWAWGRRNRGSADRARVAVIGLKRQGGRLLPYEHSRRWEHLPGCGPEGGEAVSGSHQA